MAYDRPLLERIEFPDSEGRGLASDPAQLTASIRRHLQTMLNARHGGSSTVPDYGTSDFSDVLRGTRAIDLLSSEIMRSIDQYEPRLVDVSVAYVEGADPFQLHFDIVATIVTEDGRTPAVFRTTIQSSGEMKVA
ncbi:MAG: type VI secretion system baseplate subunit TssE [Myxococcales bacterium]|nr:type VI secretion system baseplate subunit TssE [Myxococcales bacterium]